MNDDVNEEELIEDEEQVIIDVYVTEEDEPNKDEKITSNKTSNGMSDYSVERIIDDLNGLNEEVENFLME